MSNVSEYCYVLELRACPHTSHSVAKHCLPYYILRGNYNNHMRYIRITHRTASQNNNAMTGVGVRRLRKSCDGSRWEGFLLSRSSFFLSPHHSFSPLLRGRTLPSGSLLR